MATDSSPLKPQCEDALHEIYHLLSGEIDDAKRDKISAHLDECAPCAEPYDFYQAATIGGMFAAPVWHYWIGAVLMLLAVIPATVMLFIGYLRKTQSPRYPSDD